MEENKKPTGKFWGRFMRPSVNNHIASAADSASAIIAATGEDPSDVLTFIANSQDSVQSDVERELYIIRNRWLAGRTLQKLGD